MIQKLDSLYLRVYNAIMAKIAEEDGINTIEIVVILGILVALAVLFGGQLKDLFNTLWAKVTGISVSF